MLDFFTRCNAEAVRVDFVRDDAVRAIGTETLSGGGDGE
jgi:hypothetical protein